jgi:hypothetical protein
VIDAVDNHSEGERFGLCHGLVTGFAVGHHARQVEYLRKPTLIFFTLHFDSHIG